MTRSPERKYYCHTAEVISTSRFLLRCPTETWTLVSFESAAPWLLPDDVIPSGPAGAPVLPADGFDGQRDRRGHDAHPALSVPPQTAVGAPHSRGEAHRFEYPESGHGLQRVGCDGVHQKTGGGAVGDGWP